jgi:nucleotide-binding universal stress UspA family protein
MRAKRILVPIDFSEPARAALQEADAIACQQGSELTLLYVYSPTEVAILDFTYVEPADKIADITDAAEARLRTLASVLETPADRVEARVATGPVVETILELSTGYDLIVMSTHSRKGLEHMLIGSVAERVVRASRCSVLVVKPA